MLSAENIRKKLLPFVFSGLICSAICYIYLKTYLNVYAFLTFLLTAAFFLAFDFIKAHKRLGVAVYIALITVIMGLTVGILMSAPSRIEFFEWFMTGAATIDTIWQYMLSMVVFFTFFISSAVYYFTHCIYRVSVLTLLAFIPCAIFIKAAQPVPTFYTVALSAVDISLYLYNYKLSAEKDKPKFGKAFSFVGYIDFAVAVILIAVLIPKPQETPYYEKFEEFTSRFSFGGRYGQIDGSYTEHSGNADLFNEMDSRLLFTVRTQRREYYKIQVFDSYDSENRWWYSSTADPERLCRLYWQDNARALSLNKLAKVYLEYYELGGTLPKEFDIEKLTFLANTDEEIYSCEIEANDYPTLYIPAPERTVNAVLYGRNEDYSKTFRTDWGELMTNTSLQYSHLRVNESAALLFYGKDNAYESGFIDAGMCDISQYDFEMLLSDILWSDDISEKSKETAKAFLTVVQNEAFENERENVSEKIKALSDELTSGLSYDYEKAEAIEAFFNDGSFSYDLGYKAPDELDTPEYFIFESKRGTCSDFATAYCLIARAAGLSVRYVEGFNSGDEVSPNVYSLKTENAHAYPEVYIMGAGWTIYEPTVSGSSDISGGGSDEENTEDDYLSVFISAAVIASFGVLLLLIIIFMPSIDEFVFKLRVRHTNSGRAVIIIYNRLCKKLKSRLKTETELSVLTPRQIQSLILEKMGINADVLICSFELSCYGEYDITSEQVEKAMEEYKSIVKLLKK